VETVTSQSLLYKVALLVAIKFYLPVELDSGIVIAWSSFKVIKLGWFSFLVIMAFNSNPHLLAELRVKVTPLNLP
jgi:hypothetical protein